MAHELPGVVRQQIATDRIVQAPLRQLAVSPDTPLSQLAPHMRLFTHAPILRAFDPPIDPLADLLARRDTREQIDVGVFVSRRQLFRGYDRLGRHWNHAVLAVPHEQWPLVQSHLLATCFSDPQSGAVFQIRAVDTTVADTVDSAAGAAARQAAQVTVFYVDSENRHEHTSG